MEIRQKKDQITTVRTGKLFKQNNVYTTLLDNLWSLMYRKLWDHMNKMAAIILRMCEIMKDMPHSSYLSVKELLASSSWKYLHDCPDRKYVMEPPRIVVEGDKHYREHFHISGSLARQFWQYDILYHVKFHF